jgi:hypothetical protein
MRTPLQLDQCGQRPHADPDDAIWEGFAHLAVADQGIGQHRLADAAHSMDTHPRGGPGDDDGPVQVGTQGIAQTSQPVAAGQVVGRQRRHGDQFTQRRHRLAQLSTEVVQMQPVLGVIPEVFAVEQFQLIGDQGIIALPQDRGDGLVLVECELPFLPHVIGQGGPWPDNQNQPLVRGHRVLNLLVKGQPARWHRDAVKPNLETTSSEIPVQPGDEGSGRVERDDVIFACVRKKDGGHVVLLFAKGPST